MMWCGRNMDFFYCACIQISALKEPDLLCLEQILIINQVVCHDLECFISICKQQL